MLENVLLSFGRTTPSMMQSDILDEKQNLREQRLFLLSHRKNCAVNVGVVKRRRARQNVVDGQLIDEKRDQRIVTPGHCLNDAN